MTIEADMLLIPLSGLLSLDEIQCVVNTVAPD